MNYNQMQHFQTEHNMFRYCGEYNIS